MKHYLLILLAFILVCPIQAQDKNEVMSEKLKNRIWKAKILEGKVHEVEMDSRDYNWLIKTLSKSCKYPPELQEKNLEGLLHVAFEVDDQGCIANPQILMCSNRKFKNTTLNEFKKVTGIPTALPVGKDTLAVQFKLDRSDASTNLHADVLIIGYSSSNTPVLMRYDATLTAHTTEPFLEVGVPVCYLNERGDTIVPYGKYRYCQSDTIKDIGFVYENKLRDARIVCINDAGKELFYVFKYDNGPDYIQEGLFRIVDDNGLVGFADSLGYVVIKPQFKFATPFENGKTQTTTSGKANDDGEHSFWTSDEWKLVRYNGTKIMRYTAVRNGMDLKGLQIALFDKPGKTVQEISYSYPSDIEFANNLNVWANLQDVNFDGKDDILVNLGQYGNQMIQYYDCHVWDETKNLYRRDESFKQIENPQISKEKQCIFSSSRISAASYSYKRFEFIDGRFMETAALIQTFRASKQPPLFTEKQYVKSKGLVTLHKDVSVDKINRDWLSIIMK